MPSRLPNNEHLGEYHEFGHLHRLLGSRHSPFLPVNRERRVCVVTFRAFWRSLVSRSVR